VDRRTFLIATGGLLLGARGLPNTPWSEFKPARYLIMPSYSKFSAASWLELADGAWQPMLFEADLHRDYGAIEQYEKSLKKPGLNFEEVARVPPQPGKWIVRLRLMTQLYYLASGPGEQVKESDAEFWYEPEDAPTMSHADAVRLALSMLRQMDDPDVFSFYEPVRLDRAIADHEAGVAVLKANYLPTGYRRG
jgi:hypothetical protein